MVDERSEIAASFKGRPQNDVGRLTAVLDNCPKGQGIFMLLRAMSPDVIVTDEIGQGEEIEAVGQMVNAGVRLVTSAHGSDEHDAAQREGLKKLLEQKVFGRIVVLSRRNGAGTVERVVRLD